MDPRVKPEDDGKEVGEVELSYIPLIPAKAGIQTEASHLARTFHKPDAWTPASAGVSGWGL